MNKASVNQDDPLPHIQLHPSVYELFPLLRSLCHFHFPTLSDSPHSQFHHVCCGLTSPRSLKIHCFCVFLTFRPSSLKPPAAHIHLHLIVHGQVFPCESQTAANSAPKPPSSCPHSCHQLGLCSNVWSECNHQSISLLRLKSANIILSFSVSRFLMSVWKKLHTIA